MNGSLDGSSRGVPAEWLEAHSGRDPLLLAPCDERGWFGGRALAATDPVARGELGGAGGTDPLREAGEVLERAFFAEEPLLAAVLLGYPAGRGRWALYRDAVVYQGGVRTAPHARPDAVCAIESTSLDEAGFCSAVEATREAILAGDVYVLNLTRTLSGRTLLSPAEMFSALCSRAPASMAAAWLPSRGSAVLSASPERFLRVIGREVEIAPVKGTRPRGTTVAEDERLRHELATSEKERAEHVMVVDLERNDLGRVCVPGSIRVDPLCRVETAGYCHQMVSSVRGLLRPEATLGELLEATFPCGSVTGAPKIAAMDIAARLEPVERGAYTGALVVAMPGMIDSSVLIRTAEIDGAALSYGTGCGITVDSDPREEWEESVLKCAPLLGPRAGTSGAEVALKETCRAVGGAVPLWPWHRERLARAGVPADTLAQVEALVAEKAAQWADAQTRRARLTVVVGVDGTVDVRVARTLSSLDVPGGPLAARVEIESLPPLPEPVGKPADRSWFDAAHKRAQGLGAHQAVLVTPGGTVVDGSTSAVWIAEAGQLITPPAPPAIPSVSVAFVRARAEAAGLAIRVEPFEWERFEAADEAFLTNAFGGAVPVRGRGGRLFSAVAELFAEVWQG